MKEFASIKMWALEDRPREKMHRQGKHNLTESELIAILLRSGSRKETAVELAKNVLRKVDNDLLRLGQLTVAQLTEFPGLGEAKAMSIVAAFELGKRYAERPSDPITVIGNSEDIRNYFYHRMVDLGHEELWMLTLNKANRIINSHCVSRGGIDFTVADPRVIFRIALEHNAVGVVLCHNHPSGNVVASDEDDRLTERLKDAGKLLGIKLMDHLVLTRHGFYSYADDGKL